MLPVFVTYHIPQSNLQEFLAAARRKVDQICKEPKLLYHDLFSGPALTDSSTQIVRFVEVWDHTQETFTSEQASKPYISSFVEATKSLIGSSDIQFFQRLDGWCAVRGVYLGAPKTMLGMGLTIYADRSKRDETLALLRQSWEGITGLQELQFIDIFICQDPEDDNVEVWKLVEAWDCGMDFLIGGEIEAKYDMPYLKVAEEKKLLVKPREMEVFQRMEGWFLARDEYLKGAKRE